VVPSCANGGISMRVLQRGHIYEIDQRSGIQHGMSGVKAEIRYVNREPGMEHDGTTTQELLRVIIDRTHYCHNCLPHRVNEQIIFHMRMALALHEARALEQQVLKGELRPEHVPLGSNGHFLHLEDRTESLEETVLAPVIFPPPVVCNHHSGDDR
jgi:hypothetical protein